MMMLSKSPLALNLVIAFPFRKIFGFRHHHNFHTLKPRDLRDSRCSTFQFALSSGISRSNGEESYPATLPANPKGVIFDMDGTLIKHSIDFADMRRRIYAVADCDPVGRTLERDCVLTLATKLSPTGVVQCNEIFADIERKALDAMEPSEGGAELVAFLEKNGILRAVLTRNLERNAAFMRDMYRDKMGDITDSIFDPMVGRDTLSRNGEPIQAKPLPDGIRHICDLWGCDPSEVIMVGDSANDDIAAANRAGCGGAVLLTQPGGEELDTDSGYAVGDSEGERRERTPSLRVGSLGELRARLEALLEGRGDIASIENGEEVPNDAVETRSTTSAA